MTKRLFISIVLLAIAFGLKAQSTTLNGVLQNNKIGFSAGYLAYKFNHPGFQLGIENYVAETNNYSFISSLSIFYYKQKDLQSAINLNARIGQRYTAGFGLFLETYLGMGVQRTSYIDKVFEYNSSQSTVMEDKTSKMGITPSISVGLGYDFSKQTDYSVKFYFRPSVYWLYPDKNMVLYSSHAIESGLIYVPNFKKKVEKTFSNVNFPPFNGRN